MALINVGASLPAPMWAVIRLLAFLKKAVPLDQARALLTPPSLSSKAGARDRTFDEAISTLRDLGLILVQDEGTALVLAGEARDVDGQDLDAFTSALRSAVFAPERNSGLGETDDPTGPRDLTRALAWFLSLDPMGHPVHGDIVQNMQKNALKSEVGPAIVNDVRWNRFGFWAPALGLAAPPTVPSAGKRPLTPDCTMAVRQVVQGRWKPGERVKAVEAVAAVREQLPVLPGGAYSRVLGIAGPGQTAAGAALSFALLRGHDEGWLRLERDADARRMLQVIDPEQPSSPRSVSDLVILEAPRG